MTLVSILDDKPLLNEPGITETHPSFCKYNKIIEFRNYQHSIIQQMECLNLGEKFHVFKTFMEKHFECNKTKIRERIDALSDKEEPGGEKLTTGMYRLVCEVDYTDLLDQFDMLFDVED